MCLLRIAMQPDAWAAVIIQGGVDRCHENIANRQDVTPMATILVGARVSLLCIVEQRDARDICHPMRPVQRVECHIGANALKLRIALKQGVLGTFLIILHLPMEIRVGVMMSLQVIARLPVASAMKTQKTQPQMVIRLGA